MTRVARVPRRTRRTNHTAIADQIVYDYLKAQGGEACGFSFLAHESRLATAIKKALDRAVKARR